MFPSRRTSSVLFALSCVLGLLIGLGARPGAARAQSFAPGVTLCENVNFGGRCQTFTSDVPDLRGSFVGDGQASSVFLAPGWYASLYYGYGFGGRCQTFTSSIADLRGSLIGNDVVSSLRVNQPCQSVTPQPPPAPALPPQTPLALQAYPASGNVIVVTWVPVDPNATTTQLAIWQFGYSGDWTYVSLPAGQNSYTMTWATPGARYAFEVQSCEGGLCSPWSYQFQVITPNPPPAAPSNLYVTGNLPYAISVAWNDNSDNETNFVVGWWQYGVSTQWNYVWLPANQNEFLLTGLTSGTRYAFIVEAYNNGGYSAWSNQVDVTTNNH
jgi:hypothetical protein